MEPGKSPNLSDSISSNEAKNAFISLFSRLNEITNVKGIQCLSPSKYSVSGGCGVYLLFFIGTHIHQVFGFF